MKPVIFLGPSLARQEAEALLPAVYLPPVRQGDLVSAIQTYQPSVIGIIDGLFGQDLSVWHKEILYALEQGISVFGASSMGALRAAELDAFGMQGVGFVYRQYASGELNDDDEVALTHSPADLGYQKLSEPLVNIRATLRAAEYAGILTTADRESIIALVKSIYFPERTLPRIFTELTATELGAKVPVLQSFFETNYVDAKKEDARELLQLIHDLPACLSRPVMPQPFERSPLFESLYQRDRVVEQGGSQVRLSAVSRYAALHYPGFEELRFQALNRKMALWLSQILGLETTEDEVRQEARRFRASAQLGGEPEFEAWLLRNHLNEAEFQELMGELAACRKVQRMWLSTSTRRDARCKSVLDELRLRNQYSALVTEAAALEKATAEEEESWNCSLLPLPAFKDLVRTHARETSFQVAMPLSDWAEEAGFLSLEDLQMDLLRAKMQRNTKKEQLIPCKL